MSTPTDEHGQPRAYFHCRRNRQKALRHLYGALEGVSADGRLTDPEIEYLQTWLNDNDLIADHPAVRQLHGTITTILRDGVVTAQARSDLFSVIETILDRRGGRAADEKQAINHLQGFLSGIAADRELADAEIRELSSWVDAHRAFATTFPIDVIFDRVSAILADNRVTEEERTDLLETIDSVQGGNFRETGAAGGLATRHTFDAPAEIPHAEYAFCVTGKFACGPRQRVWRTIESRGGKIEKDITKRLSYLLVGTFASRDWIGTSHGRKIEKALEYRDQQGDRPLVIAEEDWLANLD